MFGIYSLAMVYIAYKDGAGLPFELITYLYIVWFLFMMVWGLFFQKNTTLRILAAAWIVFLFIGFLWAYLTM